jgi:hypothetical protein
MIWRGCIRRAEVVVKRGLWFLWCSPGGKKVDTNVYWFTALSLLILSRYS